MGKDLYLQVGQHIALIDDMLHVYPSGQQLLEPQLEVPDGQDLAKSP